MVYSMSISQTKGKIMTTYTITLTEEELHAFQLAKYLMDQGYQDNMMVDDEFGNDNYARAHRGLDSLEAKLEAKIGFEENVAYLKETYPHHSMAYIRKALRAHNKKEG